MVADSQMIKVSSAELRLDSMPQTVQDAFLRCATFRFLPCSSWYLAGGTALALQVGHRESADLDFFTPQNTFSATGLTRRLAEEGGWATTFQESGTLYGELDKTKMSFIAYPFFRPSTARLQCGHICVLTPSDIAAMKIVAISQRGRKRDFVDLYWICRNREPLAGIIQRAVNQYPGQQHNMSHILKSLVYFADAESDPMPRLFFDARWDQIKRFFKKEVASAARKLLGIG